VHRQGEHELTGREKIRVKNMRNTIAELTEMIQQDPHLVEECGYCLALLEDAIEKAKRD